MEKDLAPLDGALEPPVSSANETREVVVDYRIKAFGVLEVHGVRPPRSWVHSSKRSRRSEHHLGVMVEPFGERHLRSRSRTPLG